MGTQDTLLSHHAHNPRTHRCAWHYLTGILGYTVGKGERCSVGLESNQSTPHLWRACRFSLECMQAQIHCRRGNSWSASLQPLPPVKPHRLNHGVGRGFVCATGRPPARFQRASIARNRTGRASARARLTRGVSIGQRWPTELAGCSTLMRIHAGSYGAQRTANTYTIAPRQIYARGEGWTA